VSIDYAAIAKAGGIPKGRTRKQVKARKDREDAKQLKAFRDAVFKREHDKLDYPTPDDLAKCQDCHAWVRKTGLYRGHVHHVISRRHKSTRHSAENGRLLCRKCHNQAHGREF
jgi:5-methylcytosine-specific restriction endonuclease McrA